MRFRAPWGKLLKFVSAGVTAILLIVALGVGRQIPPGSGWLWLLTTGGPLLLLVGSLLFIVRGYRLEPGRLQVERLLWSTPVELAGLREAWHDPEAMKRSLRLFGNGGLFVIAGLFSNQKLGRYRAFATDPKSSVVLDFGERKIVVTPEEPDELLRQLPRFRLDGSSTGPR